MHTPSKTQLFELLTLTAGSISNLSDAVTALSFELLASEDPSVRVAARRMVTRVTGIKLEFQQKWQAISEPDALTEGPAEPLSGAEVEVPSGPA